MEQLGPKRVKALRIEAIVVASIVVILAALAILFGLLTRKDPAYYWNGDSLVNYIGYNGYGHADENSFFNYEKFNRLFVGEDADGYARVTVSPNKNLRNGQKIRVTLTIDFDKLPKAKYKLTGIKKYTRTFKVQDLTEVTTLEPMFLVDGVYITGLGDHIRYQYNSRGFPCGDFYLRPGPVGDEFDLCDTHGNVVAPGFVRFHSDDEYPFAGERVQIKCGGSGKNGKADIGKYGISVKRESRMFKVQER